MKFLCIILWQGEVYTDDDDDDDDDDDANTDTNDTLSMIVEVSLVA